MKGGEKINDVLAYAMDLCQASEKGGRAMVSSSTSGQIMDCSYWPDDYSQAVLAKFPGCTITFVSAQDISLTGFSICFTLCPSLSLSVLHWSSVIMLLACVAMVSDVTYMIQNKLL